MSLILTGGCLCGRTRYEVEGEPLQTTACHCADCRRASGAPFVVWSFYRSGTLRWTSAAPSEIHHAERLRTFCGNCGSPLTFFDPALPELFEVNTCTFDEPSPWPPGDQCWTDDALPWPPVTHLPASARTGPLPEV